MMRYSKPAHDYYCLELFTVLQNDAIHSSSCLQGKRRRGITNFCDKLSCATGKDKRWIENEIEMDLNFPSSFDDLK